MNVREQLTAAMETGEALTAIYHGGTQPGTKRRISLIRFVDQRTLSWCFNAKDYRKFRWKRLELVPHDHPVPDYAKNVCDQAGELLSSWQMSLKEMLGPSIRQLEEMGWHVQIGKEAMSVHLRRQNGKPRSEAVVEISKTASHSKPWCVRSHALRQDHRFYRLQCAAWLFVDQARCLKPTGVRSSLLHEHHRDVQLMSRLTNQAVHLSLKPGERVRVAETGTIIGDAFRLYPIKLADYFPG